MKSNEVILREKIQKAVDEYVTKTRHMPKKIELVGYQIFPIIRGERIRGKNEI